MAFQVKEFHSIQKGTSINWKFKLINKTVSQFNFYELDETSRTLYDLVKDLSGQMDIQIQSRRKKCQQKNRIIRKSCQKIIKALNLSLTSFANDIGQQFDTVNAFFKKQKISQSKYSCILQKCKCWSISAWDFFFELFLLLNNKERMYSLEGEDFFKTVQKYVSSYIKDGRKLNADFDLLTELYGVVIGEKGSSQIQEQEKQAQKLIQIDVNLTIDNKYISECLLYNTQNLSYIKTRNFSQHFVNDLLKQNNIEGMNKQSIQELQEQVRIQIRSQCLYKTLLKKHASILLNFSTIQIPSEVKQYLIPIQIKLRNDQGQIEFQDYFEWDILNQNNSIEEFCQQLIIDAELDSKYFSQLCYAIRTQINTQLEWKFMLLVKTFKQIHKDRQSPKLNTQTTMMIKKNLPYTMDVLMLPQNKLYKPSQNMLFLNSDVFSLLSRNIDILPQQFQSYLLEKQNKDANKNEQLVQKTQVTQLGKTPSALNKKNSWNEIYDKKNLKIESNQYLQGVSLVQSNNIWKKLMDQRTNVQ